jgi:hypothetical protein
MKTSFTEDCGGSNLGGTTNEASALKATALPNVATWSNPRFKKVYAVRHGYVPGLYYTWAECEVQVKGFPGTRFKSFRSWGEANEWLASG